MKCYYCKKKIWFLIGAVPIGKSGKRWAHHICWVKAVSVKPKGEEPTQVGGERIGKM